jgi:lysophospholipase L1-like esterase
MDAERRRRVVWSLAVVVAVSLPVLLLAYFGTTKAPTPPLPTPSGRLSSPEALAPFFAKLAALDTSDAKQRVRILQIGDSHTADDALSGQLRDRFQARFGSAGRGWLPAGIPYKYYRPHLVHVDETGWRHLKPNDHAGVALGLDAAAAESQPPDASMTATSMTISSMTLDSTDTIGFDRFALEFLTQLDGSAITVAVDDGAPITVSTADPVTAIKRFDLPLDHSAHRITLRAPERPPVVLLGWTVERQAPGVIYENHGTIGATVGLLEQMTPEAVSFELDQRRPALLVIAFGTNEGFDDGLDLDRYAARFRADVAALRQKATGVPILVLGPADGNRAGRGCPSVPCGTTDDECAWREPAKLASVREIQRHTAAQEGWAYWDWFAAMGGTCSIDRMTGANPPLAMSDRVHLSTPGYQAMADLLFGDLMDAYEIWKAQPRTS